MIRFRDDPWWMEYCLDIQRSGSRYICYPPVENTDDDYFLLVAPEVLKPFTEKLKENGFKMGGSLQEDSSVELEMYPSFDTYKNPQKKGIFQSWRNGDNLNLIVTISDEYFMNVKKATRLARYLNLKEKHERVTVFEAICFDVWP